MAVKKTARKRAKKTSRKKTTVKKVKTVRAKTAKTSITKRPKVPELGVNRPHVEGINVIRYDYLLDKRVVIATARAKRPDQFKQEVEPHSDPAKCPFCPRNQDKIVLADETPMPNTKYGWMFRSVKNLYGILTSEGAPPILVDQCRGFFEEMKAYGHAEVVIETPDHKAELEDLPEGAIAGWLLFLAKRYKALRIKKGVRYVSVFKNRGRKAGASISHTHTQIITTPFIPMAIAELLEENHRYQVSHGRDPFVDIIKREKKGPRFVAEDEHTICFTPYASETPFELWILPKRSITNITLLTQGERVSIEKMLRKILAQLNTLGKPPYNLLFIQDNDYGQQRLLIKMYPRLSTPPAGFEYITDLAVNPVTPEDAATFYKKGF
ncbi:hypothetical protein GOV10_05375 [Candidatus Woesearchaeota archaeon]|nr:hypothetical protein [Candidatus Woesearchaeota archaeon]